MSKSSVYPEWWKNKKDNTLLPTILSKKGNIDFSNSNYKYEDVPRLVVLVGFSENFGISTGFT